VFDKHNSLSCLKLELLTLVGAGYTSTLLTVPLLQEF
jgi:hypothetical protein